MNETAPLHFILSAPEIDGRRVITNVWSSAAILEQETPEGWQRVSLPHPMTDARYRMSISPHSGTGDTAALDDLLNAFDKTIGDWHQYRDRYLDGGRDLNAKSKEAKARIHTHVAALVQAERERAELMQPVVDAAIKGRRAPYPDCAETDAVWEAVDAYLARSTPTPPTDATEDDLTLEDAATLRRIGAKCAKKDYCSSAPFETSYCRTQRYCEQAAEQIERFIEIRDDV